MSTVKGGSVVAWIGLSSRTWALWYVLAVAAHRIAAARTRIHIDDRSSGIVGDVEV